MQKIPLVVIVGPTATGKTKLSIKIARELCGEVVSADSMQVYKEFNILTAKPNQAELADVKHYMINVVSIKSDFSVADYVKLAKGHIQSITSKNKLPILVGGSGLYVDSLLNSVSFEGDKLTCLDIRNSLEKRHDQGENLYKELAEVDPKSAKNIHENDTKRTIRALEFYYSTGYPISDQVERSKQIESPYNPVTIGLNFKNRQTLYENINKRVDDMVQNGLVKEVKFAFENGIGRTAACSIGYKEILPFLDSRQPLETAIENVKRETRRYAKRQITWFKRNKNINWLYVDEFDTFENLEEKALDFIKGRLQDGVEV